VGLEARDDVAERQRVAVYGDVGPALLDDGVGAQLHLGDDPVTRLAVGGRSGDAWAKVELCLDEAERFLSVERGLWTVFARAGGDAERK